MSYARYVDYFFAVRRLDSCVFGPVGSSFYPHKGHYVEVLCADVAGNHTNPAESCRDCSFNRIGGFS